MKYIRTKDDVYELYYNSEFEYYEVITKGFDRTRGQFIITENNIGKYETADTIEELCDEFVVKHINNEKPYITDNYQKHDLLKDRQKAYEYGVEIVYGAIWTTKGLIYVAKMDDEGKLVLI